MVTWGTRARFAAATLVAAGWLGASSFVGCSQVLGIQADRYLAEAGPDVASPSDAAVEASDARVDDSGLPANWRCLDDPEPATPDASVEVELFISDVSGMQSTGSFAGTPIVGAQLQACDRLDFSCQNPLVQGVTDDAGIARMTVPGGFNGYYDLLASGETQSILQRTAQVGNEYSQNAMVSPTTLSLGEQIVGVNQDPNNAVAIVTLEDCDSNTPVGATFEVVNPAPKEQVVYFVDRLPTATATSTDATGSAMIFNVPPGSMTIKAYIPGGQRLARPPMTSLTRAGDAGPWVTFMQMRPDQAKVTPPDGGR